MIRFDADGTPYVWLQLTSEPYKKITWTLSDFLAYAAAATTGEKMKLEMFNRGLISSLTDRDREDLGLRAATPRTKKAAG